MKLTSKQYEILARLVAAEIAHVRHNRERWPFPAPEMDERLSQLRDIADTIERAQVNA